MQERNDYRKTLLAIFLASLAIFTTLAYVATTPRPSEEFFQIYVLGEDHRLEHYYPNDNSTISPPYHNSLVCGSHELDGFCPVRYTRV